MRHRITIRSTVNGKRRTVKYTARDNREEISLPGIDIDGITTGSITISSRDMNKEKGILRRLWHRVF